MTPERFNRITSVLAKRQPDLTVITDEVHKGRNIAAIVRTCDAVGVDNMHCVIPSTGFQTYSGTSASAEKWVEVQYHSSINDPVAELRASGHQLIAANLCEGAVDFRDIDYCQPTALILGAELDGVSTFSREQVDHNIIIPMSGMVESFNVSVACAIVLMEAQRQRQAAGLYSRLRLDEKTYKHRFFNWAHPALAAYCDEHKLPYPPTREDGEVENLSAWYRQAREKKA